MIFARVDYGFSCKSSLEEKEKKNIILRVRLYYLLGIRFMARNGRKTRIVRMAVKFKFSIFRQYSSAPDSTMKKSKRFHESARYVFLPQTPIATILMLISMEKNTNMISSNICNMVKDLDVRFRICLLILSKTIIVYTSIYNV